jgi:hypothetical protein
MEELSGIDFKVGEKYENEKGLFEVVSIKGDQMVIQWNTGETAKSTVEFQRRIQERRLFEKMAEEKAALSPAAKVKAATSRSPRKAFQGFQDEDFSNTISKTKWRTRVQLGGSVLPHLPSIRYDFNSWSAKRQNELHWADTSHWQSKQSAYPAKFFARADETSLSWGFYIERPDQTGAISADWESFIKWLREKKNEQWLRSVAIEDGLVIYDAHQSCFGGVIKPRESDWAVEGSSIRNQVSALGAYIESWPATSWLDLMIAKRISKVDAIARAGAIVTDMGKLFDCLLPLYEAALAHRY